MNDFIFGVLSSLAATALTVGGGWIGARHAKRWPVAVLSRLTGVGVVRRYASQRASGRDLAVDLACASEIAVMTGRGNELARETFQSVWQRAGNPVRSIRVLLPDPDRGPDSWLARREAELADFDPGFTPGLLPEQIRANIAYIAALVDKDPRRVELRLVDLPQVSRLIITDQVAYVTTVTAARHGHDSPCLVFRKPGPLYDFALRMFETAWEGARVNKAPVPNPQAQVAP